MDKKTIIILVVIVAAIYFFGKAGIGFWLVTPGYPYISTNTWNGHEVYHVLHSVEQNEGSTSSITPVIGPTQITSKISAGGSSNIWQVDCIMDVDMRTAEKINVYGSFTTSQSLLGEGVTSIVLWDDPYLAGTASAGMTAINDEFSEVWHFSTAPATTKYDVTITKRTGYQYQFYGNAMGDSVQLSSDISQKQDITKPWRLCIFSQSTVPSGSGSAHSEFIVDSFTYQSPGGTCNTNADTNCDKIVSRSELGMHIDKWIQGQVTRTDLGLAIQAWVGG